MHLHTLHIQKPHSLCLSPSKPLPILNSFYPFTSSCRLLVTRPCERYQLKVVWIMNAPTHEPEDCVCSQPITRKCKYLFQSDLIFNSDLPPDTLRFSRQGCVSVPCLQVFLQGDSGLPWPGATSPWIPAGPGIAVSHRVERKWPLTVENGV